MTNKAFVHLVQDYYQQNARELPWRQTLSPYAILVSEIMLQQTQAPRVVPKYQAFLTAFPYVSSLAAASLSDVLRLWSGLGYNRRAKFLLQSARLIDLQYKGKVPNTLQELLALPGIGKNTAGAILAYAFNQPIVFVEANIRTVLLHHFFAKQTNVSDQQLSEKLAALLPLVSSPREFYWALMDYGTHLKRTHNNISRSKHYKKQSAFLGSKRQLRGQVIKQLLSAPCSEEQLQKLFVDARLQQVINELVQEQMVVHKRGRYILG
jgi:A/G-specific adenine glycosylase